VGVAFVGLDRHLLMEPASSYKRTWMTGFGWLASPGASAQFRGIFSVEGTRSWSRRVPGCRPAKGHCWPALSRVAFMPESITKCNSEVWPRGYSRYPCRGPPYVGPAGRLSAVEP